MNRIGLTMGDPAGVGPEILLRVLAEPAVGERLQARVFASRAALEGAARRFGLRLPAALDDVAPGVAPAPGGYRPEGGRAAMACLEAAAAALAAGEIDALVTGPLHKRALAEAGMPGCGHTEWLARRFDAPRVVMMLAGPRLRVVLATHHLPLRAVPAALEPESLAAVVRLAHAELTRYFLPAGPRLALAALNPHAEENGRPGREERAVLAPVVERLRAEGIALEGPVPADAVFALAAAGRFDAVVALYHDQGLGPLKTLHFNEAVNVTLGLGRVRTSPDHGPAYDRAAAGGADPGSLRAAIGLADAMASRVAAGG